MNYQVQFAFVCLTLNSYDRFHAVILARGARWHSVFSAAVILAHFSGELSEPAIRSSLAGCLVAVMMGS